MSDKPKKIYPRRQTVHSIGLDPETDLWLSRHVKEGWKKNAVIMALIRKEMAGEKGVDRIEHLTRIGLRSEDHALRLRAIENQKALMLYDPEYQRENRRRLTTHPVTGDWMPVSHEAWVDMVGETYEELIGAGSPK